ncbi:MAG TPA: hypothetical protein VGR07_06380, partial [Thermoanaerobaculia bacterium]|nr:hypothetical protein [Thermoanaerobaculia bacterium]
WSDLSVPVLDFNVYLTGYDVQSINLRDVLKGNLPQTASAGQDPSDTISPHGAFSQDINFASCQGQLPTGALPASFIQHLESSLTGQFSSLLGGCAGLAYGDHLARGYVTVDTVNNCTLRFPGDLGYFAAGGTGDATNQNVLWGDYFYVNSATNRADGETLVHIEASATHPETSVSGQYTFYGRYVGWTAVDNREPLATKFAARFVNGGPFSGGTNLVVWRDSKVRQGAFKCGTTPSWYPLGTEQIMHFDEQEHMNVAQIFPVSPGPVGGPIIPFPAEAQSVAVGGPSFPVPYRFGWLLLDLNTTVTPAGNVPPEDPAAAQAWIEVVMSALGRYSVGFDALQLDSACAVSHTPIRP